MKILTLDIETVPAEAYVWRLFKENIPLDRLIRPGEVLCFAAKWLDRKEVMFFDSDLAQNASDLLSEADAVVTYNGNSFDIPLLEGLIASSGMLPPDPFKSIDLIQTIKKRFRFDSNKLQFAAGQFGLGSKADTGGFKLWLDCMAGDEKALAKMKRYNIQDVRLTEKLYLRLLPWLTTHPNYALYTDTDRPTCDRCGGEAVVKKGTAKTSVCQYQRYRCKSCGAPLRGRYQVKREGDRENVLRPEV